MIEEDYQIDIVEEDTAIAGMDVRDSTIDNESTLAAEKLKEEMEFTKEDRIKAF